MKKFTVVFDGKSVGEVEAENPVAAFIVAMNLISTEETIYVE